MKTPTKPQILRARIKGKQALYGYSNAQMAVMLRMSERTYVRQIADPGNMKLELLLRLEKVLKTELIKTGE